MMQFSTEESKTTRLPVEPAWQPSDLRQAKPATVLIVDDDPAVTETFARMLVLEGYNVRAAVSAEAGLKEAEAAHPDAILLDLRMPMVDGLAFLKRLRASEAEHKTPVAIVTGDYFLDDTMSNELHGLGAEVFFKPLWIEDLVRITQALVR
jgi:two-component system response regulator MprA